MHEQTRHIHELLRRREVKKADVLIAKHLRTETTPVLRSGLLLLRARARLLSARPEDALSDLQQAIELEPQYQTTPAVSELMADCYLARFELASVGFSDRSDVHNALQLYEHVLEANPNYDNIGWVLYQKGRALLTLNQVPEAEACFQQGLFSSSHVGALTAFCYERIAFIALYDLRDAQKALVFVQKAIDTYPVIEERRWVVQAHILRSRILKELHRYDQALKAARTAVQVASMTSSDAKVALPEALLMLSELLHEGEGHEREVISCLQQFMQYSRKPLGVDVTWSRVHEMLGDAYFKSAQYPPAAVAYENALHYNPYHPWELSLLYRMARSLYQCGDYERSGMTLRRMIDAARKDGQPLTDYRIFDLLGNTYFAQGDYGQALTSYQQALELAPADGEQVDKIRSYHNFALEMSRPL